MRISSLALAALCPFAVVAAATTRVLTKTTASDRPTDQNPIKTMSAFSKPVTSYQACLAAAAHQNNLQSSQFHFDSVLSSPLTASAFTPYQPPSSLSLNYPTTVVDVHQIGSVGTSGHHRNPNNNVMMKLYSTNSVSSKSVTAPCVSPTSSTCSSSGSDSYDWNHSTMASQHQHYMMNVQNGMQKSSFVHHVAQQHFNQQNQNQQFQPLDQINFLVRKECMSEIDQACEDLSISAGK